MRTPGLYRSFNSTFDLTPKDARKEAKSARDISNDRISDNKMDEYDAKFSDISGADIANIPDESF